MKELLKELEAWLQRPATNGDITRLFFLPLLALVVGAFLGVLLA